MLYRGIVISFFTLLIIGACATPTKHHYTSDVQPSVEIQKIDEEIAKSRQQQYDVLAPRSFDNATRALADAKGAAEEGKDRDRILWYAEQARMHITANHTRGEQIRSELDSIVKARENALAAGVSQSSPKELKNIDDDLIDATAGLEKNSNRKLPEKEFSRLQAGYMNLELQGILRKEIGAAENYIQSARNEGASRYAPDTLESAVTKYNVALRTISANRHSPQTYAQAVNEANEEAKKLLKVTINAKNSRNMSPEEIALVVQDRENRIEAEQARLQNLESETAVKNQAIDSQMATIRAQNEQLQAANAESARQREMDEKLKSIEGKFDESEAEVYRQGNNVVLRLKSIQFPSARADLPEGSLATLAKVTDVITELNPKQVVVEGHTDSLGGKVENMKLSQKRATAVSKYLTAQNAISEENVETKGYGFDRPITSNKTAEGRAQNRRVDIVITPEMGETTQQ